MTQILKQFQELEVRWNKCKQNRKWYRIINLQEGILKDLFTLIQKLAAFDGVELIEPQPPEPFQSHRDGSIGWTIVDPECGEISTEIMHCPAGRNKHIKINGLWYWSREEK